MRYYNTDAFCGQGKVNQCGQVTINNYYMERFQ